MNLNPFLDGIYKAYVEKHKPQEARAKIEVELTEARAVVTKLETMLQTCGATEEDIQKFLINSEELMGSCATESVLTNMLVAKYGGEQPQAKRRGRGKAKKAKVEASAENAEDQGGETAAPNGDISQEEKAFLLRVMTRESMSIGEVAEMATQDSGNEWLPADVSPILKALLKEGLVTSEGERRGKRYMLAAQPE